MPGSRRLRTGSLPAGLAHRWGPSRAGSPRGSPRKGLDARPAAEKPSLIQELVPRKQKAELDSPVRRGRGAGPTVPLQLTHKPLGIVPALLWVKGCMGPGERLFWRLEKALWDLTHQRWLPQEHRPWQISKALPE